MKKSLSVLLTSVMAVSMLSSSAWGASGAKSSADFTDLQNLDAASKAKFDTMISAGVFSGIGETTFGVNDKMNRAQFAKVAALVFGLPVDASLKVSSFSDVRADDQSNGYALPYIEALKQANLSDGVGENRYNPAGEVTKEQLAAFWMRGLKKEAEAQAAVSGANDQSVSGWAKGYAALAVQLKLMDNGADGTFKGTSPASRELLVTSAYEAKRQYVPGAAPAAPAAAGNAADIALTGSIQAQVKGVLQEKTGSGWRFGAAVKFTNTSNATVRIPEEIELRAKTADGTVYTLAASADGARSIAPQSFVEVNYLKEVDKNTNLNLTNLVWIHVNQDVYPKEETTVADVSVGSQVWLGTDATIQDPALLTDWGAEFSVPGETSALKYSATDLSKQFNGQAPTYVVQLKVENLDSYTVSVPDFTLSGKAEGRTFIGTRVEPSVTLKPGEKKYVHYAISTESDTVLTAFYVLSKHNFLKQGATAPVPFYTGKIGFRVPAAAQTQAALPLYQSGTPIAIDALSKAVNPQLEVSLLALDWFENEGQGYKTVVAKVKYFNKSGGSIPVPQLGADIVNEKGVSYSGGQSAGTVKDVLPGVGAMVTYSFTVPKSEASERFTFRLLEQQGAKTAEGNQPVYKTPISRVNAKMSTTDSKGIQYSMYPYQITMENTLTYYYLTPTATPNEFNYNFRGRVTLDIKKEEVVSDPANPKLMFQVEGADGRMLATKTYMLSGDGRLVSGDQFIDFESPIRSAIFPIVIKVYEVVSTPNGDARRYLTTFNKNG